LQHTQISPGIRPRRGTRWFTTSPCTGTNPSCRSRRQPCRPAVTQPSASARCAATNSRPSTPTSAVGPAAGATPAV